MRLRRPPLSHGRASKLSIAGIGVVRSAVPPRLHRPREHGPRPSEPARHGTLRCGCGAQGRQDYQPHPGESWGALYGRWVCSLAGCRSSERFSTFTPCCCALCRLANHILTTVSDTVSHTLHHSALSCLWRFVLANRSVATAVRTRECSTQACKRSGRSSTARATFGRWRCVGKAEERQNGSAICRGENIFAELVPCPSRQPKVCACLCLLRTSGCIGHSQNAKFFFSEVICVDYLFPSLDPPPAAMMLTDRHRWM